MEKEVKIIPPEGYEIDRNNSSLERIVFKKKENPKPRSWEEYCSNLREGFYFGLHGRKEYLKYGDKDCEGMKTFFLDPYDPKTFEALMQLISLRRAWIGDWEPNFNSCSQYKWCIEVELDKVRIVPSLFRHYALSFPTLEMALEFMDYFKDLLEVAKPLI